jgi:hypothetical protein
MRFVPKPANDFAEFIRTYYEACRRRSAAIEASAGKWTFRDLIPGLSDVDGRLIVHDGMTTADWCALASAVGEAHLDVCRRYAGWSRILEHTPGICLTWAELSSEATYHPEYQQWTFYHTQCPDRLRAALDTLARRPWDRQDELFHLRKFCRHVGRYDRTIDPGCNLGPYQNQYSLHSRLLHYFAPAVQSALCLLERRHIAGKLDAIERARQRVGGLAAWDVVGEILQAGYETPAWYAEPQVTRLDDLLEAALVELAAAVRDAVTLVPAAAGLDVRAWQRSLDELPSDPAALLFDSIKFARLLKGRLQFYLNAPRHFDPQWCLENELQRIGGMFFTTPFRLYWQARTGQTVSDPVAILANLCPDPLTAAEVEAVREFARITTGPWQAGREREVVQAVTRVYDRFFGALDKITSQARAVPQATREVACVPQS